MSFESARLQPGLQVRAYVVHPHHALIAPGAMRPSGPNIGARGENLTISFLSLNRSSLSIRLLESIARWLPGFAGEVLVVDNGSEASELAAIRATLERAPFRSRVVELGSNYGVAGGRNRTMEHVQTEWVVCLDNDIFFTQDPLPAIQADIALLGCRFLNLPLLEPGADRVFANGGHLYVTVLGTEVHVGGGTALRQEAPAGPGQPFLSTFLFGGASVLHRDTFVRLGGYDEGYFVGFEDTDFSIKLLHEGYKIGNTGALALVHEHPAPASDTDRDYERKRFARAAIRSSALHFERKHGLRVWSEGIDEWLKGRHRELGLDDEAPEERAGAASVVTAGRPRIALVPDVEGWAFDNIAQQVRRNLSDRYDFVVIPMDVLEHDIAKALLVAQDCDLVHFFWREHVRLLQSDELRRWVRDTGVPFETFHERFIASRVITTAVYDHLFLSEAERADRRALFASVDAYSVSSRRLFDIYRTIGDYPPPAAILEDGVDLERFRPAATERFDRSGPGELVVGWAGNSRWATEREDSKGVRTILRPAIEQLAAEGLRVRPLFADRAERMISHRDMPAYYSRIDVYVCTSEIEGTPNPVLEAMACGVPVVSTDVGIVPDLFGRLQRRYILRERSVECLKDALRELALERERLRDLSAENLRMVAAWNWQGKARAFAAFFDGALSRRHGRAVRAA